MVEIDAAGGRFRYPVHPVGLSHGEGAAALAFELAVPPIEAIRSIRVLRDGSPLLTRDATQGAPRPLMAARPGPGPRLPTGAATCCATAADADLGCAALALAQCVAGR